LEIKIKQIKKQTRILSKWSQINLKTSMNDENEFDCKL